MTAGASVWLRTMRAILIAGREKVGHRGGIVSALKEGSDAEAILGAKLG